MTLPRITIATVNRNYGRYLGQAIESVRAQGYPNMEYFVLDAGSTDESLSVIERNAAGIDYWRSARDAGPAAALNEALDRATGEWFYYLNSDDFMLPGSLSAFAAVAPLALAREWISGGRHDVDADGRFLRRVIPWRQEPHLFALRRMHHVAEGTFLNVAALRRASLRFDESFSNIFDTVLYTHLDRRAPPLYADADFAAMRWHGANKSGPANVDGVRREGSRFAAQFPAPSASRRLVERLQFTRLSPAVKGALAAAFRLGLAGERDLEAAVPDGAGSFRLTPLRSAR